MGGDSGGLARADRKDKWGASRKKTTDREDKRGTTREDKQGPLWKGGHSGRQTGGQSGGQPWGHLGGRAAPTRWDKRGRGGTREDERGTTKGHGRTYGANKIAQPEPGCGDLF